MEESQQCLNPQLKQDGQVGSVTGCTRVRGRSRGLVSNDESWENRSKHKPKQKVLCLKHGLGAAETADLVIK